MPQKFSNLKQTNKKKKKTGLPWCLSGKESVCQCRRHGFDPWYGKIPHAVKQLSPWATTMSLCSRARELQLLKPKNPRAHAPQREKPLQWEAQALHLQSSLPTPQLEKKVCPATKTQHGQRQVKLKNKTKAGTSLTIQGLRLHGSNVEGVGSIPGHRTKITHTAWCGQNKKIPQTF